MRSFDGDAGSVPVSLTTFVGREKEQLTVRSLVAEHRLVSLSGSGGAGKTRLAQQVATDLVRDHPGGTWWVELAAVSDGSHVAEHVARALGVTTAHGIDVVDQIVRRLGRRGAVLVVLDNAEHVLDDTAQLVALILARCVNARVLVTTREPLDVPGEVVWRVPSLATPGSRGPFDVEHLEMFDASRLFLDRARRCRPNLVLDGAACAAIASICVRLDGIPLALELAAARVRSLPLDRVADGLDQIFRSLIGAARTVVPRQQTMLASISWSVDLLDDVERSVLRRLAVFRAAFPARAAEAVCAGDERGGEDVLDVLARLVDKSLVQLDDNTGRYRLLETVRQFGMDRLIETGEVAAMRDRHARWWADWCLEVGDGLHGVVAGDLAWAMPDVIAAEEWARTSNPADVYRIHRGLGWQRIALGHWAQLERSYEFVVNAAVGSRDAVWAAGAAGLCPSAMAINRTEVFDLLPSITPRLDGDPGAQRMARMAPALLHAWGTADLDMLRSLVEDTIIAADALAYPHTLGALITLTARLGYVREARLISDRLAAQLASLGLTYTCDTAKSGHYARIELEIIEGRLGEARALIDEREPTDAIMVFPTAAAAITLAWATDDDRLAELAEQWIDRKAPPFMGPMESYARGQLAAMRGDHQEAARLLRQRWDGAAFARAILPWTFPPIACALLACGQLDEARRRTDVAINEAEQLGAHPLPMASMHYARALIHLAHEHDDDALDDVHAALALAHSHHFALLQLDALELIAGVTARRNAPAAARVIGATTTERQAIGYRQHVVPSPHAVHAVVERLAAEQPAAFAEGRSLSIDAVVEYARRARGARGRPTIGWGSLTPTEHQVARLVADGLGNAAIAQRLFVSPATVKSHLTHIYAKLAIANRTELAIHAAGHASESNGGGRRRT